MVGRLERAVKLGNTTYEQRWQDYIESSGEGAKLDMNRKADALPVSISPGSATAHETWFAPRTVRKQGIHPDINFLEMDVFLNALEQQNELKLDFSFKTYGTAVVLWNAEFQLMTTCGVI